MSNTFRLWFLFLASCAMAGLVAAALTARPGLAQNKSPDGMRNDAPSEVRMDVDFTILPKVLPDGTEAAVSPDEQLTPEPDLPNAAHTETPRSAEDPAVNTPAATVRPAPEPEDKEQTEIPAISPVEGTGMIRSVALDETAQRLALTVVTNRPVGRTTFMNLTNPRRLVVDILGKWTHKGGNVLRSEGMVKHVIMGEHPDHFRMVIHFRTPPQKDPTPEIRKAGDQLHILVDLS